MASCPSISSTCADTMWYCGMVSEKLSYSALNVMAIEEWNIVLYQISTNKSNVLNFRSCWWPRHRRYCSTHLLTTSYSSSIYGCYKMLILSCVPDSLNSSHHKWIMNIGSRWLIIDLGIPCNLIMYSINFLTTIFVGNGWVRATKCIDFLRW